MLVIKLSFHLISTPQANIINLSLLKGIFPDKLKIGRVILIYDTEDPILGDPGAVSGGGKKAKRARKKIGRRKVKKESRSPWDSSLNRPVPKPFKILACDWAQKYFLCPIRVQLFSCYFRDFLFESVHRQTFCSPVRHLFTCSCRRVSLDRKVPLKREP